MEGKKEVDVLDKKHPTVKELKEEIIRLRKSNEDSNVELNHYKDAYKRAFDENKSICSSSFKLSVSNNQLEANNKALKENLNSLKSKLDKANKDYKELKAKRQYNTVSFVIVSLIALIAVIVFILRLVYADTYSI